MPHPSIRIAPETCPATASVPGGWSHGAGPISSCFLAERAAIQYIVEHEHSRAPVESRSRLVEGRGMRPEQVLCSTGWTALAQSRRALSRSHAPDMDPTSLACFKPFRKKAARHRGPRAPRKQTLASTCARTRTTPTQGCMGYVVCTGVHRTSVAQHFLNCPSSVPAVQAIVGFTVTDLKHTQFCSYNPGSTHYSCRTCLGTSFASKPLHGPEPARLVVLLEA